MIYIWIKWFLKSTCLIKKMCCGAADFWQKNLVVVIHFVVVANLKLPNIIGSPVKAVTSYYAAYGNIRKSPITTSVDLFKTLFTLILRIWDFLCLRSLVCKMLCPSENNIMDFRFLTQTLIVLKLKKPLYTWNERSPKNYANQRSENVINLSYFSKLGEITSYTCSSRFVFRSLKNLWSLYCSIPSSNPFNQSTSFLTFLHSNRFQSRPFAWVRVCLKM